MLALLDENDDGDMEIRFCVRPEGFRICSVTLSGFSKRSRDEVERSFNEITQPDVEKLTARIFHATEKLVL